MPRGCGVVVLLGGVVLLRCCGRGCRLSGHDCRFTQVSRPFHEVPTVRSALPTTGSKSHHATEPCSYNSQSAADASHTFACNSRRHRLTTPQKPQDPNGSVSNSEMLSWELHATFAELHPLWSITPDQWALHPIRTGAMLTDRVHGLIGDKLRRRYTSWAARPPPTGPTLRTISLTRGRSHGPHRRVVGIRPQSRLFLSGVTPLRGHYTSSELVQCSLTGAGLGGMARLASCWSSNGADLSAHRLVAQ